MSNYKGDFKDLVGFSKVTNEMKLIAMASVGGALILVLITVGIYAFQVVQMNEKLDIARREHFVIDPVSGHRLKGAFRTLTREDRKNQYKALVRRAVSSFYSFDGATFKTNLKDGVHFVSQEVSNVKLSDYLKGNINLGNQLKDNKEVWYVHTDSILIDMDNQPIRGIYFGKQQKVRPYGDVWQRLISKFEIKNLDRVTENNEYAAVVSKWWVVDDKPIKKKDLLR